MREEIRRREIFKGIAGPWDLVVVGGGITGAGIFREAAGLGLKVLLLEQRDFAWGTSSRSGKLVHGGLRYLKQGQVKTTRHSIREREHLLQEAPGLVEPLGFLLPVGRRKPSDRVLYGVGLLVYDLLAGRKTHHYYPEDDFLMLAPNIDRDGLKGGYRYEDAVTDDARLVLRQIFEGEACGGTALNYAEVVELLTGRSGQVAGVVVKDLETGQTAEVEARAVINATGAWVDGLRGQVGGKPVIRPLRGSHLIFHHGRFPVAQAISFLHPRDSRPIYVIPWEGVTLVGTTDLDHRAALDEEPSIAPEEREYLLDGVRAQFPAFDLRGTDVMATFAGVRPVVGTGKEDPSRESRDMLVLDEAGLVTITGGKLTTFRILALEALKMVSPRLSINVRELKKRRIFDETGGVLPEVEDPRLARRLLGRYGNLASSLVKETIREASGEAGGEALEMIPDTPYLWAELRHAARNEHVVHLDDLLLRRARLGLLLPEGGLPYKDRIKALVAPELGWDARRWEAEVGRYKLALENFGIYSGDDSAVASFLV
ncbi:MAG: glycerol-3-phosphate dehydrogenase/oxidase [Firmicutes bacterium]|nr:glycerol-3-phosphate dehydrogenase/oxidase [Bacillota bacterium]